MNNYPSNNFSTVVFLVVLFIGMGLLIYHTYEITNENGQLKETVGTLQAGVETLNKENTELKTANVALTDENSKLKATVEKAGVENTSLKTENTTLRTANIALTDENNKLKASDSNVQQMSCGENSSVNHEILLSTFVPIDLEAWMRVKEIVLVIAILFIGYIIYTLTPQERMVKENHRPSRDV